MRLIVDGDGCPDKDFIVSLSKKYQVEMYVFVDYAHVLHSDEYHVISCDVGHDSVDMMIVNHAIKDDIVITQDYGLASLLLNKGVRVLHTSGKEITNKNIDTFLSTRYIYGQMRKSGQRTKGPAKRTKADRESFVKQLDKMLKDSLE